MNAMKMRRMNAMKMRKKSEKGGEEEQKESTELPVKLKEN